MATGLFKRCFHFITKLDKENNIEHDDLSFR